MNITTGLEIKVDKLAIPLGARTVSFQHPESEFSTQLGGVPASRVGELWVVHLLDRYTKAEQHMIVLSKEPDVSRKALDVSVLRGAPNLKEELEAHLKSAQAPFDVHYTTESLYGGDVVLYKYRWFEVTA